MWHCLCTDTSIYLLLRYNTFSLIVLQVCVILSQCTHVYICAHIKITNVCFCYESPSVSFINSVKLVLLQCKVNYQPWQSAGDELLQAHPVYIVWAVLLAFWFRAEASYCHWCRSSGSFEDGRPVLPRAGSWCSWQWWCILPMMSSCGWPRWE